MKYFDVYLRRINHLGENTAERIKNGGSRSFQKWLDESPHTVRNLSVERGLYFEGIILTNKDKEHEKIMFLNVANDIPLRVGDIMNWEIDLNTTEKWLLVQEEKKVNGTYRTFWIVKCNYLMKWIDNDGHLKTSWSYFVSSLDSKIKGNFRTWHNLISPQPNKYAELLMPRYEIARSTNFIVENESWQVVEYDHTSVPGVVYISLTENKINMIYDDVEKNIADTDKLAKYDLLVPQEIQSFNIGQHIEPVFTIIKNGTPIEEEVELSSANKKIIKKIDGILTAIDYGQCDINIKLKNHPEIIQSLTVEVKAEAQEFSGYIEGPSSIRLDREATYSLKGFKEVGDVVFVLEENEYAKIITEKSTPTSCTVKANNKNKLGNICLRATYQGKEYQKNISIIPLW